MSPRTRAFVVRITLPLLVAIGGASLVFWAVSADVRGARSDLDANARALGDHESRLRVVEKSVVELPRDLAAIVRELGAITNRLEAIESRQRRTSP